MQEIAAKPSWAVGCSPGDLNPAPFVPLSVRANDRDDRLHQLVSILLLLSPKSSDVCLQNRRGQRKKMTSRLLGIGIIVLLLCGFVEGVTACTATCEKSSFNGFVLMNVSSTQDINVRFQFDQFAGNHKVHLSGYKPYGIDLRPSWKSGSSHYKLYLLQLVDYNLQEISNCSLPSMSIVANFEPCSSLPANEGGECKKTKSYVDATYWIVLDSEWAWQKLENPIVNISYKVYCEPGLYGKRCDRSEKQPDPSPTCNLDDKRRACYTKIASRCRKHSKSDGDNAELCNSHLKRNATCDRVPMPLTCCDQGDNVTNMVIQLDLDELPPSLHLPDMPCDVQNPKETVLVVGRDEPRKTGNGSDAFCVGADVALVGLGIVVIAAIIFQFRNYFEYSVSRCEVV